jgi:electron transfer flavoprotein alpha subunit
MKKTNYSDVWIIAEQRNNKILKISYELVSRGLLLARKRGCRLCAMIFSDGLNEAELVKLSACGVDTLVSVEAPSLKYISPETYSACICHLIDEYKPEIILSGATSTGRTIMPYTAMKMHAGLTADCTLLDIDETTGDLLQTRPAAGGNIMATIRTPQLRPQMATVRPHSSETAVPLSTFKKDKIIRFRPDDSLLFSQIKCEGFIPIKEKCGIQDAKTVVVVGKGIKKAENISLVRELADALGASLGATRDVVDRTWLDYSHQIGLSGKTITPQLYIGIGVSGAIQHLAGMQTSETIIAVNNDPDAQIFKVADFGIVGDLFEVVPAMIKKIKENRGLEILNQRDV